ncbi:hypothetical protein BSKO_07676 [Bryopsis sp. KO-2023]|nr:hypothetical protein BSKO_07676 [Bryopsis sp. KO-2023]
MSINEKAETAFVDALENVEEVIAVREKLTKQLKKGFFELSQARYSMGSGNVGELKYKPDTEPTTGINIDSEEFELCCVEGSPAFKALNPHSQIKQENQQGDPLQWFGGMVSPYLRSAQASFSEALPLIAELAKLSVNVAKATEKVDECKSLEKHQDDPATA